MGKLSQGGNVRRFSVSLPPTLVDEFDEMWKGMSYENRSKAVHDSLRSFMTDVQWTRQESAVVVGVVMVLHYLDKPGLLEEVALIQHKFRSMVKSIQRIYVEDNKVMEIIAVEGEVGVIKSLTQRFAAMKGVKQVKASLITP